MGSASRRLGGRYILNQLIQAAVKVCAESLKDLDIKPLGGFMIHPRECSAVQSGIARDIGDFQSTLAQNT